MRTPERLRGHWETADGAQMARDYLPKVRSQLAGGARTDMETAFHTAMLHRHDLSHEAALAMAKDRIRWLSAQLARANDIIGWMMPHIGGMCPPPDGLFDLNEHCFVNTVPDYGKSGHGRPVNQESLSEGKRP